MMITDYECVDGAVECSTLTPEQATGCLRYAGIRIGVDTLRDGISQGVFPFALVIEAGKRNFIISRYKLEKWIEEFAGISISVAKVLQDVQNL
jgi:hypothetical protein